MNIPTKSFTLKDFSNLDNSCHSDFLIQSMQAHYTSESMLKIKKNAIKLMNLQPREHVCELGCGLGHDAAMMAELVGADGYIAAVDKSEKILLEAHKLNNRSNIAFSSHDAVNLPFADNTFDACRAERLLVSQKNIPQVFDEMIRVLKPTGRLCITSLDFGSLILAPYITTVDKIIMYWQNMVENPFVGRQLPALFNQFNLQQIKLESNVFHLSSYETLKTIVPFEIMLDDMVAQKHLTHQERQETVDAFIEADQNNTFYWSINLVTAVGKIKII